MAFSRWYAGTTHQTPRLLSTIECPLMPEECSLEYGEVKADIGLLGIDFDLHITYGLVH